MILDGKATAKKYRQSFKEGLEDSGKKVGLVVIQVGNDEASSVYVKNKKKACEEAGIIFTHRKLDENIAEGQLLYIIDEYNNDPDIHGILVQLPLPRHIDKHAVMNQIKPEKDVDGFTDVNIGKLNSGRASIVPCTALGIMLLLDEYNIDMQGKHCVVVGRSDIVGKPVSACMLGCDATVTVCHSKTENLKEICRTADILICAIGKPKYFTKEYVKPGAVVVDVGIHRCEDGTLCGDVDFDDVEFLTEAITPVPGGVGPMTVAGLVINTIMAAEGVVL